MQHKHYSEAEIQAKLLSLVSSFVNIPLNEIDAKQSLFDYGIDSLHLQELLGQFEKWYGQSLSENILFECDNIESLSNYLSNLENQERSKQTSVVSTDGFEHYEPYLQLKRRQADLALDNIQDIFFDQHEGVAKETTIIAGRQIINFASYNYLGLSGHPRVNRSAINAIRQYGTSVSASRLVSGQKPLHQQLEDKIATFIGTEDCIVFNSGYGTNISTISHLMTPEDLILHDELAHNSIIQGAVFSRAKRLAYHHNDSASLEKLLESNRKHHKRALIITEGVFSMDGDYPDLSALIALKKKYGAMLMVDEAHSIGTMGATGRGISEHFSIDPAEVDIWMGTLSKSLASCGGFIAGSKELIEYLKFTSPGFVFSAGISPADTAAALAALTIITEEPQRVRKLQRNAQYAWNLASRYGFNIGLSMKTAVLPVILGDSRQAIEISIKLKDMGFNIKPIIYPAVPETAARLRIFIISRHTRQQIKSALDAIRQILAS